MVSTRAASGALCMSMVVLLVSCASDGKSALGRHPPPSGTPRPCGEDCNIRVTVTSCTAAGGVSVDVPFASVDSPRVMRWTIVTPGYVFSSGGIAFDPYDLQFVPLMSLRPDVFRVFNRKASTGEFAYYVNVQGCVPLDPWIKNQ